MKYNYGLGLEELEKRTSKDYLVTKKMLDVDSKEFLNLKDEQINIKIFNTIFGILFLLFIIPIICVLYYIIA